MSAKTEFAQFVLQDLKPILKSTAKKGVTIPRTICTEAASLKSVNAIGDTITLAFNKFLPDMSGLPPELQSAFRGFVKAAYQRKPQKVSLEGMQKVLEQCLHSKKFVTQAEKIKYLRNIENLASKKAPNGNYILKWKDVLNLANFKTGKFSQGQCLDIKKLIFAIEKGALPSDTLTQVRRGVPVLSSFDKVNPLIIRDIEKMKYAEQTGQKLIDVFLPEYESFFNFFRNEKEVAKYKAGDIICFKKGCNKANEVYMFTSNNGRGLAQINVDRKSLFRIMPPVQRFYIEQAHSGTCYQLASYTSQMQNPKSLGYLYQRIMQEGNDITIRLPYGSTGKKNLFAGKFPDFDKHGTIITKLNHERYKPVDSTQSAKTNTLIKALETEYGAHRKYTFADQYVREVYQAEGKNKAMQAYSEALSGMNDYIYVKKNGKLIRRTLKEQNSLQKTIDNRTFMCVEDYYKEAGKTDEMFNLMNKYGINEKLSINCQNDTQTLEKMRKYLSERDIIEFGTKHVPSNRGIKEKNLLPEKSLYANHAYSIVGYDKKTDIVQYINPWNSAYIIEMPLKELAKYISELSVSIKY